MKKVFFYASLLFGILQSFNVEASTSKSDTNYAQTSLNINLSIKGANWTEKQELNWEDSFALSKNPYKYDISSSTIKTKKGTYYFCTMSIENVDGDETSYWFVNKHIFTSLGDFQNYYFDVGGPLSAWPAVYDSITYDPTLSRQIYKQRSYVFAPIKVNDLEKKTFVYLGVPNHLNEFVWLIGNTAFPTADDPDWNNTLPAPLQETGLIKVSKAVYDFYKANPTKYKLSMYYNCADFVPNSMPPTKLSIGQSVTYDPSTYLYTYPDNKQYTRDGNVYDPNAKDPDGWVKVAWDDVPKDFQESIISKFGTSSGVDVFKRDTVVNGETQTEYMAVTLSQ